jgi:hypothetical protein
MKRRIGIRSCGLLAFVLALALFAAGDSHVAPVSAQTGGESAIPCNPKFARNSSPLKVEQGGTVDVEVKIEYNCRSRDTQKVINLMLVVSDNINEDFNSKTAIERNLRAGLGSIINQLPWSNGSKAGLVIYNDTALTRSPLRQGIEQRDALIQLTKNFRINRGTGSTGMDNAMLQAWKQLPTQIAGEINMIVLFDSGANPYALGNACRLAERSGVIMAGVQLPRAGGRIGWCMNAGLWTATDNDGSNLEEIFEKVGESLFKGDNIEEVIVSDYINCQWANVVPGSSSPVAPINPFACDFEWSIRGASSTPAGGLALTYQLKITDDDPSLVPEIRTISDGAEAFVRYASGAQLRIPLNVDTMCIAGAGKLQDHCGGFVPPTPSPTATIEEPPTDTPEPPTETPTRGPETDTPTPEPATDTPTPEPATETPTDLPDTPVPDTATPTAEPTRNGAIYLPFLLGDHDHRIVLP